MILEGDYIRDKRTGKLHAVREVAKGECQTVRLADGVQMAVPEELAIRVVKFSGLPGEPEVTECRAI